jgi:hypothetical protein
MNYCIDFDTNKYYQQNRIITIVTVPIDLKVKHVSNENNTTDQEMKPKLNELSNEKKKSIVDSYVANYLNSFYNDPKKYKIEWMRMNDGIILMKITQTDSKNVVFHKFDSTLAVMDDTPCPESKTDPKIKEFIRIQEFCKSKDTYKLKYALIGSDQSSFVGFKVSKAKLEEVKSSDELEKFKQDFGTFDKISTYRRTYRSYSGVCGSGNCGLGSSLYTYPYSYGNYWYGSYYLPPVVSSIVPTAPVITYTPYTYNYPVIGNTYGTSLYTLGSYYSPYTYSVPYSYTVPYTYVAPYTYSIPYTYYVHAETFGEMKQIQNKKNVFHVFEDEFDRFPIIQRNKKEDIEKYLH